MKESDNIHDILNNSNALLIFIHLKKQNPKSLGIREIRRATLIRSASTVSRQLGLLEKSGLAEKDSSSKYKITDKGLSVKKFDVDIKISVSMMGGFIFTFLLILLCLVTILMICSLVFLWFSVAVSAIISLIGLVISIVFMILHWIRIRRQLRIYQFVSKK